MVRMKVQKRAIYDKGRPRGIYVPVATVWGIVYLDRFYVRDNFEDALASALRLADRGLVPGLFGLPLSRTQRLAR